MSVCVSDTLQTWNLWSSQPWLCLPLTPLCISLYWSLLGSIASWKHHLEALGRGVGALHLYSICFILGIGTNSLTHTHGGQFGVLAIPTMHYIILEQGKLELKGQVTK